MNLKPVTRTDLLTAALLAIGYFALLAATCDGIGYTRDESFYFEASQVYQGWFHDVTAASTPEQERTALGKKATVDAWAHNFEHPPLMKSLFGFSWRLFGRKIRDAAWNDAEHTVVVTGLQPTEGFERGAVVDVAAPMPVLTDGTPGTPRRLATGTVIERKPGKATLALQPGGPTERGEWNALCNFRPDRVTRGCTATERRALALADEMTAFRLPACAMSGLLLALIYLFGASTLSRAAGLFGAVTFGLIPRHFFHAHLICFDMPITTMVMATLYAYALSERSRRFAVVAAVLWGLALLTKLNAFFLPLTIGLYWLLANARELRVARGPAGLQLHLPRVPLALVLMPPIGLTLLFVLWPKLWYDPFRSFSEYIAFHMNHVHYAQEYFGRILAKPPFPPQYAFVVTFFTVPALVTLVFFPGLALFLHRSSGVERDTRTFYVVNLLVPIGIIALPGTPIFGGVKHWLPSMPFFCLLAGYGAERFVRALAAQFGDRRWLRGALAALVGSLTVASLSVQTADAYPHLTAYWNEWMGGFQGAASTRMQRQFWGHGTHELMPFVNRTTPQNGRVDFHETTCGSAQMYKREGWLRADVGCSNAAAGTTSTLYEDYRAIGDTEFDARETYDRVLPDLTVQRHGVPLIQVYRPRPAGFAAHASPPPTNDDDGGRDEEGHEQAPVPPADAAPPPPPHDTATPAPPADAGQRPLFLMPRLP